MGFKSDIEIAQECEMLPITKIAEKAGIDDKYLEQYGKYKAKIDYNLLKETDKKDGKLILVTAINPTPAGEGKTTVSVGLADALRCIGKKSVVALREPSLGPVFGIKGGAAGGGYSQVVPMEDINLHFTGDFHAHHALSVLRGPEVVVELDRGFRDSFHCLSFPLARSSGWTSLKKSRMTVSCDPMPIKQSANTLFMRH